MKQKQHSSYRVFGAIQKGRCAKLDYSVNFYNFLTGALFESTSPVQHRAVWLPDLAGTVGRFMIHSGVPAAEIRVAPFLLFLRFKKGATLIQAYLNCFATISCFSAFGIRITMLPCREFDSPRSAFFAVSAL